MSWQIDYIISIEARLKEKTIMSKFKYIDDLDIIHYMEKVIDSNERMICSMNNTIASLEKEQEWYRKKIAEKKGEKDV